ncbi:MAG: apolipoprotein N-acyltransferase [bacterium]
MSIKTYVLAISAGVILVLSFPPVNFTFLIWFALVPLFLAIYFSKNPKEAAIVGSLTGLVFYGISLNWFFKIFGVLAAGLICLLAIFIGVFSFLVKYIYSDSSSPSLPEPPKQQLTSPSRKSLSLKGLLLFIPVCWVALEFFRSELWCLKFPWLALGYSQWNHLPLLQLASLGGVYGLSFLIALVNGVVFRSLLIKRSDAGFKLRWHLSPLIIIIIIMGIALYWGNWVIGARTHLKGSPGNEQIVVAAIQDESFVQKKLMTATKEAARDEPKFIVWREYSTFLPPGEKESRLVPLLNLAKDTNAYLVIGFLEFFGFGKKGFENYALLFSPKGRIIGKYTKIHLIHFIEWGFEKGKDYGIFETEHGKVGIQICFDLDYEDLTRRMVKLGAEMFFVPSLNPMFWGKWEHLQHSAMAPLRAVESRRWIVRAASSGMSQIIDPYGRVLDSLPIGSEGILIGKISANNEITFYHQYGWVFPYICLGGLAAGFGMKFFLDRGKRGNK